MNDVSRAILDNDRVSSFTCLFDGLISKGSLYHNNNKLGIYIAPNQQRIHKRIKCSYEIQGIYGIKVMIRLIVTVKS